MPAISQSRTATTRLSRNIMFPIRPSPHDKASGPTSEGRLSDNQSKHSDSKDEGRSATTHSWYARQWFAPNNLNKKAITDTVRAVYLPYWTFDAKVFARWRAESGTYYTVREGGKDVRKVRWSTEGRGKRGGVRVIYYFHREAFPLFFDNLCQKPEGESD